MEVGRGNVSQKSLRGPAEKVPQHFSVCTRAIMHCIWKGTNSPKKATLLRGFFLVQGLLLHKLSTEGYRDSEDAEEAVEEHAEEHLLLFCPRRVGIYWPATT